MKPSGGRSALGCSKDGQDRWAGDGITWDDHRRTNAGHNLFAEWFCWCSACTSWSLCLRVVVVPGSLKLVPRLAGHFPGPSGNTWGSRLWFPIASSQVPQQGARSLGMRYSSASWMHVKASICHSLTEHIQKGSIKVVFENVCVFAFMGNRNQKGTTS